jgi:hypothetical protein
MSGMFPARGVVLGFLIPGLREVVLVVIVALVLYGRGGHRLLMATKYGRSAAPWLRLVRIPEQSKARWGGRGQTASPKREPRGIAAWWLLRRGRWFWAVALTLAAVMAAWVATRVVIHASAGALR